MIQSNEKSLSENRNTSGIIFDIKKYAIHDGPGIRTTVFLKGCPLHCWWCHNPEGQNPNVELGFQESKCLDNCTDCVTQCRKRALSKEKLSVRIDRKKCKLYGDCVQACPTGALDIIGKERTVKEVMDEIEKDRIFYEDSNGGVTFSGGEPLLQLEFLDALLKECQERNLHTIIDTCGYAPFETFKVIQDKVDIFFYDIKMIDEKKHTKTAGASNKIILENLKKLTQEDNKIIIRIPVIPGINDTLDSISEIVEFLNPLPGLNDISLLPYHKIGVQKYKNLDVPHKMDKTSQLSTGKISKIKKRLEDYGFKVRIGG